jgi:hypothetical protein
VSDIPVTFRALSYALFDVERNGVLTTVHGNLAIFSTLDRGVQALVQAQHQDHSGVDQTR